VLYLHGKMLLVDLGEILIAHSHQDLVFEIFPGSNNKKKKERNNKPFKAELRLFMTLIKN
jgi:hypothetical protein